MSFPLLHLQLQLREQVKHFLIDCLSVYRRWRGSFWLGLACIGFGGSGCGLFPANPASPQSDLPPRSFQVQQEWQFQPGSTIAGYSILAGLGDVSLDLRGGEVRAPFDGQVQINSDRCVVFSSPEVPAYLIRLCGLDRPKLGAVKAGDAIGKGKLLHVAVLRRQPDGTWALVEPSAKLLEQLL